MNLNNTESNTTADSNNNHTSSPAQHKSNHDPHTNVEYFEVKETSEETFLTSMPNKSNGGMDNGSMSGSKNNKEDQFNIHLNF
jgi:hypothetical protein